MPGNFGNSARGNGGTEADKDTYSPDVRIGEHSVYSVIFDVFRVTVPPRRRRMHRHGYLLWMPLFVLLLSVSET